METYLTFAPMLILFALLAGWYLGVDMGRKLPREEKNEIFESTKTQALPRNSGDRVYVENAE